jgi:hypothetical protein
MRETRQSGSEGGESQTNATSLPLWLKLGVAQRERGDLAGEKG